MRNLRTDQEDRLREVDEEQRRIEFRINQLQEVENALRVLLQEETLRIGGQQLALLPLKAVNGKRTIGKTRISAFLLKVLAVGQPRPLRMLTELARAEGIDFENKNPSRVLHFALIGLQRNGYALRDNGVWRLTPKATSGDHEEESQISKTEAVASSPSSGG